MGYIRSSLIIIIAINITCIPITPTQAANKNDVILPINYPAISQRCDQLLKKREQKIKIRRKLDSLIIRNKKLQSKASITDRQSILEKLKINMIHLKEKHKNVVLQVNRANETIILSGCPAISL